MFDGLQLLTGVPVTLHIHVQDGVDAYNRPIYVEEDVEVQNVLVGTPTAEEFTSTTSEYGRSLSYVLGIPKGDSHVWEGNSVTLTGLGDAHTYDVIGIPIVGIEENVPGPWHMKVKVARHE